MKQTPDFKGWNPDPASFPTSNMTNFVIPIATVAFASSLIVTNQSDRMSRFPLMSTAAQEFAA